MDRITPEQHEQVAVAFANVIQEIFGDEEVNFIVIMPEKMSIVATVVPDAVVPILSGCVEMLSQIGSRPTGMTTVEEDGTVTSKRFETN